MKIQQIPYNLYSYIAGGDCLCLGNSWCLTKVFLFSDEVTDCFHVGLVCDANECRDVIGRMKNPVGCSSGKGGVRFDRCVTGDYIERARATCRDVS